MARIKIDSREIDVAEGAMVLSAAREAGINIPSLCHNDNLPHYTSCMVCMVRDNKSGNFFASCSMPVQEGMDIDVSSEEVVALRKKSLELLFSEHRAECEAPCRVVCPAGYNIPLFNRHLSSGNMSDAEELTLIETGSDGLACINCPGYCENACRRKKIDTTVSIRNMKIFIYGAGKPGNISAGDDPVKGIVPLRSNKTKRFNSLIGKLEAAEQQEWLKECLSGNSRSAEIVNVEQAVSESAACMHCDCRASGDCRLRDLADEFKLKDPRAKLINAPIVKKINHRTGLIFENAKCIKCGLCVRLCEQAGEEPAVCFVNRGFISIISEPLTVEFDDILVKMSREVADICPTGALKMLK